MKKANNMKLRTLIALSVLWKYSDENHKLSSPDLSAHLESHGFNYTKKALTHTVHTLREFGADICSTGRERGRSRVWWANRPLDDDTLDKLVFAVRTNPYITNAQAEDIMSSITPFITVYQEYKLKCSARLSNNLPANENMYRLYSNIQEAIEHNKKVVFTQRYIKYDKKTGMPVEKISSDRIFSPRCICASNDSLYLFGYNHMLKQADAIPLEDISMLRLEQKYHKACDTKTEEIDKFLNTIDPDEYILQKKVRYIPSQTID